MLEALLARHAAPVLAGMKTANLFSVQGLWLHDLQREIFALTKQLAPKGLRLMLLCPGRGRALVYVYRPALLARDLERPEARALLSYLGYPQDMAGCLLTLKRQMAHNAQFPHEIGLFLGYPLCDVLGFLRHAGRHSKCACSGRCMTMWMRRWRCLPNTKNARMYTRSVIKMGLPFGS